MADVVCNNFTGRVIELKLGNHFTYIGSVAELHANYRKSKLVGKHLIHGIQIPIYIASLENLRYLNLSNLSSGRLCGSIPSSLGNLYSFTSFDTF
ncbi:hypothetical protein CISIN_1g034444mg [Citrus sinensis]|uniref:Uncharacterized protein n=1 Tax=Citrus sinensis TaxID=2711 RepID=A0A067F9A4_CITSI|nr:hypothetical protein CISIN_1g034444mg [Citrus sinensis]